MKSLINIKLTRILRRIYVFCYNWLQRTAFVLNANVYFGRYAGRVPGGSIVFFPCRQTMLGCGIAGIVAFKNKPAQHSDFRLELLNDMVRQVEAGSRQLPRQNDRFNDRYLGGSATIEKLWQSAQAIKTEAQFFSIFSDENAQGQIERLAERLSAVIEAETGLLAEQMGYLAADIVERVSDHLEKLKDITWFLKTDILSNTKKIRDLLAHNPSPPSMATVSVFQKINAVLNSIDRLEVRGRDSAGVSTMFIFDAPEFQKCEAALDRAGLLDQFKVRCEPDPLVSGGINCRSSEIGEGKKQVAVTFTYIHL